MRGAYIEGSYSMFFSALVGLLLWQVIGAFYVEPYLQYSYKRTATLISP